MARRARRGGGYRNNPYNRKHYQFTSRRRAALKRAQAISAKKRGINKVKVGLMAAGGVAAVGAVAYMGRNTSVGKGVRRSVADSVMRFHPEGAKYSNLKKARSVVQPGAKEATRVGGAVSPAGTPHQPGHVGAAPAAYPHAPGFTKGDPSTYKHTVLDPVDHNALRQDMQDEDDYLKTTEGSLEKFIDPGDAGISRRLIAGQKVTKSEMRRAYKKRNAAIRRGGVKGGQVMSDTDIERELDRMVAGGNLTTNTRGKKTATRTNPRAVPRKTAPNSGMTQQEIDEALNATELPIKPVLGIPVAKGGARGAVKIPGAAPAPYLGDRISPWGSKTAGTAPLTPQQKAANTRRKNKAAKAAQDAKPAETSTPQFSHQAPHAPSAPKQPKPAKGHKGVTVGGVYTSTELEKMYKNDPYSVRGQKISGWGAGQREAFQRALIEEKWRHRGFFVTEKGELGLS